MNVGLKMKVKMENNTMLLQIGAGLVWIYKCWTIYVQTCDVGLDDLCSMTLYLHKRESLTLPINFQNEFHSVMVCPSHSGES